MAASARVLLLVPCPERYVRDLSSNLLHTTWREEEDKEKCLIRNAPIYMPVRDVFFVCCVRVKYWFSVHEVRSIGKDAVPALQGIS